MGVLDGKIAVVTGGSRGIGKGCAQELGAAGATVYVVGRTVKEGEAPLPGTLGATAESVDALGGKGIAVRCDLGDDAQVEAFFDRVREEQGRLDILVNSAFGNPGLGESPPFWETPLDWYDTLMGPGTRGAYVASAFAARIMVPQKSGLIVNVSALGAQYFYQHVAYGMGKAALDKLSKDAGRQLREYGIPVISIWPYFVKTEQLLVNVEKGHPIDLEGAESQRFVGKGVVALATDPNAMDRTGKPFTSYELAVDYGYEDEGGGLPGQSALPKIR
jgi:NAD(P)-dependent dehydrogenase (short-subunit alcohol dehydrogenase family)